MVDKEELPTLSLTELQEEVIRLQNQVERIRLLTLEAVKRELKLEVWPPNESQAYRKDVFEVIDKLVDKENKERKKKI